MSENAYRIAVLTKYVPDTQFEQKLDDTLRVDRSESVMSELDEYAVEVAMQIVEAKADVLAGRKSPIVYYMLLSRMDWAVLADAMHRWQWVIKRHAKPSVFKKLSSKTLQQYAEVFGITVEELCKLNK